MLFDQVIVAVCEKHLEDVLEVNHVNAYLFSDLLIVLVDENLVHQRHALKNEV